MKNFINLIKVVKVKTVIQKRLKFVDLRGIVKNNNDVLNSVLITDDFKGYKSIKGFIPHCTVNHSKKQFYGVFTNIIEILWVVLKRGCHGIFHHIIKLNEG